MRLYTACIRQWIPSLLWWLLASRIPKASSIRRPWTSTATANTNKPLQTSSSRSLPAFALKTGHVVPDHRADRDAYKEYDRTVQPEYLVRIHYFLNNAFFKKFLQPALENMNARRISFEAA